MLRSIFRNKGDEVTGETKMIHNDKVNSLCSSTDIIRVIRSRRMGFGGRIFSWVVTVYIILAGEAQEKGHKRGYDDNTEVS
jgi:hypothetical protein